MKRIKIIYIVFLLGAFISLESCGPIIISSQPSHPTPPWFYPNRVVNVRYVYFPEYTIYYDLTLRNYLYYENNVWIRVNVLPPRYNGLDFRRARQVRVQNYFDDSIRTYHSNRIVNEKGRRTTTNRN
ncbi:hypothetical protein SAMN04515667_1590 [Formosa sp. Hel1_31_208]|uniref:hypothetical protein n=1 Tax=Formosa sp. Hel1_31_208 TaxID=1798225 RepID=UPI00087DD5F0|nr:hypothetical protein [Formosa sp. Hel1_31_208]SDS18084.1 hypothetical protein SAMN04515667_1590 [Formosa sp. Hel1_31_208]